MVTLKEIVPESLDFLITNSSSPRNKSVLLNNEFLIPEIAPKDKDKKHASLEKVQLGQTTISQIDYHNGHQLTFNDEPGKPASAFYSVNGNLVWAMYGERGITKKDVFDARHRTSFGLTSGGFGTSNDHNTDAGRFEVALRNLEMGKNASAVRTVWPASTSIGDLSALDNRNYDGPGVVSLLMPVLGAAIALASPVHSSPLAELQRDAGSQLLIEDHRSHDLGLFDVRVYLSKPGFEGLDGLTIQLDHQQINGVDKSIAYSSRELIKIPEPTKPRLSDLASMLLSMVPNHLVDKTSIKNTYTLSVERFYAGSDPAKDQKVRDSFDSCTIVAHYSSKDGLDQLVLIDQPMGKGLIAYRNGKPLPGFEGGYDAQKHEAILRGAAAVIGKDFTQIAQAQEKPLLRNDEMILAITPTYGWQVDLAKSVFRQAEDTFISLKERYGFLKQGLTHELRRLPDLDLIILAMEKYQTSSGNGVDDRAIMASNFSLTEHMLRNNVEYRTKSVGNTRYSSVSLMFFGRGETETLDQNQYTLLLIQEGKKSSVFLDIGNKGFIKDGRDAVIHFENGVPVELEQGLHVQNLSTGKSTTKNKSTEEHLTKLYGQGHLQLQSPDYISTTEIREEQKGITRLFGQMRIAESRYMDAKNGLDLAVTQEDAALKRYGHLKVGGLNGKQTLDLAEVIDAYSTAQIPAHRCASNFNRHKVKEQRFDLNGGEVEIKANGQHKYVVYEASESDRGQGIPEIISLKYDGSDKLVSASINHKRSSNNFSSAAFIDIEREKMIKGSRSYDLRFGTSQLHSRYARELQTAFQHT